MLHCRPIVLHLPRRAQTPHLRVGSVEAWPHPVGPHPPARIHPDAGTAQSTLPHKGPPGQLSQWPDHSGQETGYCLPSSCRPPTGLLVNKMVIDSPAANLTILATTSCPHPSSLALASNTVSQEKPSAQPHLDQTALLPIRLLPSSICPTSLCGVLQC